MLREDPYPGAGERTSEASASHEGEVDQEEGQLHAVLIDLRSHEALHHARQLSYERVVANEQTFDAVRPSKSHPQRTSKVAVA